MLILSLRDSHDMNGDGKVSPEEAGVLMAIEPDMEVPIL